MVFEITEQALKVMTLPQVKSLTQLDGWRADKIVVHDEGACSPGSQHGEGNMLIANIWRSSERTDRPIFVVGVMPNGDMHS